MPELYGASDLFIHTSLQDNLPLTLCEAQVCGIPTICFDVGGCPETMISGETVFLVSEPSSKSLAEKIEEIYYNREQLDDMRSAARSFAMKQFNPQNIAAAYTEVFEKAGKAKGLMPTDTLYSDLVQNQIASLADFCHNNYREQITLQQQQEEFRQQYNNLKLKLNELQNKFKMFKQNLKHPLRFFIRKIKKFNVFGKV